MKGPTSEHYWGGVDVLRLAAVLCVFWSHALSILDAEAWSSPGGFRLGRLGTTLFFVIGGYLAAKSQREPLSWIVHRLRVLFPPYWIMLVVAFSAAGLTHYKRFDLWQIACQFAGVGLFTHGDQLVNVTTWFISAMLVMYLVALVAKRTHEGVVICLALGGMAILIRCFPVHASNLFAATLFLVAYLVALFGQRGLPVGCCCLLFYGLGILAEPEFRYGFVALVLFGLAIQWQGKWPVAQRLAGYTYEWYLVHGLALHFANRIVGQHIAIMIPLAAVASLAAAVALKRMVAWIESAVSSAGVRIKSWLAGQPRPIADRELPDSADA